VVVSNFTATLDDVAALAQARGWKCLRIDGSVPSDRRQRLVNLFNTPGDPFFLMLLSARAGGVGLNLIGASRLVMFDPDWNPATDAQAMGRVWRDGQTRPVFIYRLLSIGTIDEVVVDRQLKKGDLASVIGVQGTNKPSDRDRDREAASALVAEADAEAEAEAEPEAKSEVSTKKQGKTIRESEQGQDQGQDREGERENEAMVAKEVALTALNSGNLHDLVLPRGRAFIAAGTGTDSGSGSGSGPWLSNGLATSEDQSSLAMATAEDEVLAGLKCKALLRAEAV